MFQNIKTFLLWFTLFALGGYYYYIYTLPPCARPIEYHIGTLDPRFGVSQAEFEKDIARASSIWESEVGTKLFVYKADGKLAINLVYDDRQAKTQQESVLSERIDQTTKIADSIKKQYTDLKESYQQTQDTYLKLLAQFNAAQSTYNAEVAHWNSLGGAPEAVYKKLQETKTSLLAQKNSLDTKRAAANNLANQINSLINTYNLTVQHVNQDVESINNDGLAGTQIEEGVYILDNSGERINIYQFENNTDLVRVLSHELGHARNLEHNDNPDSIMNPLNQSDSLKLSSEDLAALRAECRL